MAGTNNKAGEAVNGRMDAALGAFHGAGLNGSERNSQDSHVTAQAAIRLLVTLMDSTPDRIYFKDRDSRFILVNKAQAAAFGMTPDALVGKTDFDVFSEEHARAARDDEQRVVDEGQPVIGKVEKETWPDGRTTWCSSTKMPLYDDHGRIVGTFGISRDITGQHLAQEALKGSEERYRELLSAVPTYTYSVHFRGGNPVHTDHGVGCRTVTGYASEEFAADPDLWMKMIHPADRVAVLNYVSGVEAHERIAPVEHRIVHKDGRTRWIRNTIILRWDSAGQVTGYDGLIEDISDRKRVEEELQKTLKELERRVRQRTAALAQTNTALQEELAERQRAEENLRAALQRLDELDKAKTQFVFNITHELKTPLASLRYALENMLKGVAGELSGKQAEYIALMQRGVDRILLTTQEILDVSRIEARTLALNLGRTPAADFVRRSVSLLGIVAEQKPVSLAVDLDDVDTIVEWDLDRMERVIHNVVENAIKFTPAGGQIEVTLRKHPERADFLALTVTDNGVGIRAEHLSRVMERYYRADPSIPGIGLGLSICRDVVALHGGEVSVASPPPGRDRGTQVALLLPVVAPIGA